MNNLVPIRRLVAVAALLVFAMPVLAQNPAIDYIGFGWETGGFLPSEIGDEMVFVCHAVTADPVYGVDLGVNELTFHLYDLVSEGEVNIGGGNLMINYSGGYLDIWRDGAQNAEYGVYPPNATVPSTFTDGTLFFRGSFNYLTLFVNGVGNGTFEGGLNGVEGEVIGGVCTDCSYTWGGAFLRGVGAQIPDGYDLQVDGLFELDGAVANDNSTWGGVKSLYDN